MDFSYILLDSVLQKDSLIKAGFQKVESGWKIRKDVPESEFYAEIILAEEKLTAEVYEKSTDEQYLLLDVVSANGKFVSEIRQKVQNLIKEIQKTCFVSADVKTKYVEFLESHFGTKADYPWADTPDYSVFRCKNQKWFALIMKIKYKQLGLASEEPVWVVNMKADPEKIPEMTDRKSIFPAYHMNKKYWITVLLTSITDFEKLCSLTERSFNLVN